MSATLIHHGHIRLLQKAAAMGEVIVALTTDEEIIKHKGYTPELNYEERKEILESISYVKKVVASPWYIDFGFLKKTGANILVHGDDNSNNIPKENIVIFERTKGISSSLIRARVLRTIMQKASIDTTNL